MCLPYHKKKLLFEILWKYSYLINIFINQKTLFYLKLGWKTWKNLEEITSTINELKIQVGIFYSYQTIWVALVRPPSGGYCYLNHACIVIYLCPHWVKWSEIQMKFLDKVYWFWIRNWLCAFLIIKRNFCLKYFEDIPT